MIKESDTLYVFLKVINNNTYSLNYISDYSEKYFQHFVIVGAP